MRANEFIIETQELDEIERLRPNDYEGGKSSLHDKQFGKQIRKLPGGSGLLYSTNEGRWGGIDIKLWDPNGRDFIALKNASEEPRPVKKPREYRFMYERRLEQWKRNQQARTSPGQLVGKLSVSNVSRFPLKGAVQVDIITVDEDYRGVGLAKALYGIVLTILKKPLLAGGSQTPGGRKNWVSLASIPGVEMKGYIEIDDDELDTDPRINDPRSFKRADQNIDTIMGKLGGQHLGNSRFDSNFFSFDVKPNTTSTELEAYVKTNLSKVYGNYDSITGLYAIWTGKQ